MSELEAAIDGWLNATGAPLRWYDASPCIEWCGMLGYGIDRVYDDGDYSIGGLFLGATRLGDGNVVVIVGLDDAEGNHYYVPVRVGDSDAGERIVVDTRHSNDIAQLPDSCKPTQNGWHCSPVDFFTTVDDFFADADAGAYDGKLVRIPFVSVARCDPREASPSYCRLVNSTRQAAREFKRFGLGARDLDYRETGSIPAFVNSIPDRAENLIFATSVELLICEVGESSC